MGRALNWLAELADKHWLMTLTGVSGAFLAFISVLHQGGDTVVPATWYDWFAVVGFGLMAFALVCAHTQLADRPTLLLIGGAFALAFLTTDSNRFLGTQFAWLWLLLAVAGGLSWLLSAVAEPEDYMESPARRFCDTLWMCGFTLSIGLLAIYHTWSMLVTVAIIDVVLFVAYQVLVRYKPAPRQYGAAVRA